jgi:hypothetical protein
LKEWESGTEEGEREVRVSNNPCTGALKAVMQAWPCELYPKVAIATIEIARGAQSIISMPGLRTHVNEQYKFTTVGQMFLKFLAMNSAQHT